MTLTAAESDPTIKEAPVNAWIKLSDSETGGRRRRVIIRMPNKTAQKGEAGKVGIPDRLLEKLEATPPRKRNGFVVPGFAADCERDPPIVRACPKRFFSDRSDQ